MVKSIKELDFPKDATIGGVNKDGLESV